MKLYNFNLSGNCYKVRLFLALLGLEYETVAVDLAGGQERSAEFLAINPLGQVPVLVEGEATLRDSQAILVHLALAHSPNWYPLQSAGEIQSWLSLAANEIANGPAALRLNALFGARRDAVAAGELTRKVLALVEKRLTDHHWLVGESPTVADVACYPYLFLAPDGGVDLTSYPQIRAWFGRIDRLRGFVGLISQEK